MANGAKDKKRRTILEAYYQVIKNTTPGLAVMSRPIDAGKEGKECRCKGHTGISWSMNVTMMSKHQVEDCTACSQEHKGWLEKNSRSNQIGENKRQCLPGYVMVSGSSAGIKSGRRVRIDKIYTDEEKKEKKRLKTAAWRLENPRAR